MMPSGSGMSQQSFAEGLLGLVLAVIETGPLAAMRICPGAASSITECDC